MSVATAPVKVTAPVRFTVRSEEAPLAVPETLATCAAPEPPWPKVSVTPSASDT